MQTGRRRVSRASCTRTGGPADRVRRHPLERLEVLLHLALAKILEAVEPHGMLTKIDALERRPEPPTAFVGVRIPRAEIVHDLVRHAHAQVVEIDDAFAQTRVPRRGMLHRGVSEKEGLDEHRDGVVGIRPRRFGRRRQFLHRAR